MERLIQISDKKQIPEEYRGTPIASLLEYHNLGEPYTDYSTAQMLIGACMDFRVRFQIPLNYAFMIRTGGANMKNMEFKISYAISVGGIKYIAIIGHSDCAMTKITINKNVFIRGLVKQSKWSEKKAIKHFSDKSHVFEIKDEIDFTLKEVNRLKKLYGGITIVPMIYEIEDSKLYLIKQ